MTLECSVVIFQALEYLWPQWPQQPQQPQWPQWPQQPHFTIFFTEFYVSMNTGTKMTYVSWSLNVEWIIKNSLIAFWHPFSWRLWRPSYETKIKFKAQISKPNECTFFAWPLKKPFCPRTPTVFTKVPTLNILIQKGWSIFRMPYIVPRVFAIIQSSFYRLN